MTTPPDPKPPVIDEIIARIQAEAAARRATAVPGPAPADAARSAPAAAAPFQLQPEFAFGQSYAVGDFTRFHGAAFVTNAYRALLGRQPDAAGLAQWTRQLGEGLSKVDILGRIRYSGEGRRRAVPVRGLLPAFALATAQRVPLLAHLVALARLPAAARHHRSLEAYSAAQDERLLAAWRARDEAAQGALAAAASRLEAIAAGTAATRESLAAVAADTADLKSRLGAADLAALEARLASASAAFYEGQERTHAAIAAVDAGLREALADATQPLDEALASLASRLEGGDLDVRAKVAALEAIAKSVRDRMDTAGREIGTLGASVKVLATAQPRLAADIESTRAEVTVISAKAAAAAVAQRARDFGSAAVAAPDPRASAAFYAAFEERFRGSREAIRQRLLPYLPLLREAGAGTPGRPLLDLGCGRGEWLELLRDEGLAARGVDSNEVCTRACRDLGLVAHTGDLFEYLRDVPDGTLGAVTAIHVIEHFPLPAILQFIADAHRSLAPGGLLVLETPNPENLLVGACNFYTDPTHVRPLPPPALAFFVENGGFAAPRILRLAEHRLEDPFVADAPGPKAERALVQAVSILRHNLLAAPDYAIVAAKR